MRAAFDELRQIALQLSGERRIERNERLVEQAARSGEWRTRARAPRAARDRPRVRRGNACDALRGRARRTRRRPRLRWRRARRAARCPRRCATAGAAAPETPCPPGHASGMWTEPSKSRSRPARMRISVDLPQPDGPISAPVSPSSSAKERSAMNRNALTGRGPEGLSRDARFKPRAVASARHDVQRVAPRAFR